MSREPVVYVVDDDAAVRDALGRVLRTLDARVECCESADALLAAFEPERPGCVVLDVRLGQTNGLDLQDTLRARGSAIPIIVITAYGTVPTAVRAMQAGALDVLEKPFDPRQLLARVRQALERDEKTRTRRYARQQLAERVERLSPREQEVLGLSVAGKTAKEIGETLQLSSRTVEVHRAHILGKVGAPSMADLVKALVFSGEDDAAPG